MTVAGGVVAVAAVAVLWLVAGPEAGAAGLGVVVLCLLAALTAEVVRLRRQLASVRRSHQELKGKVDFLRSAKRKHATRLTGLERRLARLEGRKSAAPEPPTPGVGAAVAQLVEQGEILAADRLLRVEGELEATSRTVLRKLLAALRSRGYLTRSLEIARVLAEATGQDSDRNRLRALEGEVAVLTRQVQVELPADPVEPVVGTVLHVVGNSLPDVQSGYTLRTHYTAVAQKDAGLDPHVVTQLGVSTERDRSETIDGVTYHRLGGPRRNATTADAWFERHVHALSQLVRELRPAVLHAASDYVNGWAARIVGDAHGIPVVYESRGFWEETWLSRQANKYGWTDLGRLEERYGLPDVYLWRSAAEQETRAVADHVVTLADVMAERICAGGVPEGRVHIVPNAVDVDAFPVLTRDEALAAELGLPQGATVVGYISSIVEYEGIDTLVRAFAQLLAATEHHARLLIVGDGLELPRLRELVAELGIGDHVTCTGSVPHEQVLGYYSLIDVFVVPRKPVEVCHLVTPLKPFEAFSTGRTVVMSDVRALRGIAEQSGAAATFRAGDPGSLAEVLDTLIRDPERRAQMAADGAHWVRRAHTWAGNAGRYLRLYESVGASQAGMALRSAVAGLVSGPPDVAALREWLRATPRPAFERLASQDRQRTAETVIRDGWQWHTFPAIVLDEQLDWRNAATADRSWAFRFHAWDFMGPVLNAYEQSGDSRLLDWCVRRAVGWAREFLGDGRTSMAWYDMALGLRSYRLAYLTQEALLHGCDEEDAELLTRTVARHAEEVSRDGTFNAGTNHGFYVAVGQLAMARRLRGLPGMDMVEQQGRLRLLEMAERQFSTDGGHVEHSPDYHRMLLDSFTSAMRAGLVDDPTLAERLDKAQELLGWFIQPDGTIVQLGDSPSRLMLSTTPRTDNPFTQFLETRGKRGRPNPSTLAVLPETGYAVVRSPQPQAETDHGDASYLTLNAAFHSRAHKHADDLSLTWFDRGAELLVDAGRFGYGELLAPDSPDRLKGFYYAAPERQYVESTRAHNTVEADATDHDRRNRKPYGSALGSCQEAEGHYYLSGYVEHESWRHERQLVLDPGRWLWVLDRVESTDGQPHDFRMWLNFAAERDIRLDEHGTGLLGDLPGDPGGLRVVSLSGSTPIDPVCGGRDPLRGWRSTEDRRLDPAWSTGFVASGVRTHEFSVVLAVDSAVRPDRLEHPFEERVR